MIRYAIEAGDRLTHLGRSMRFEGRRGEFLDWFAERTQERLALTDAEVASAIARGDAKLTSPSEPAKVSFNRNCDFTSLPAATQAEARVRLDYVRGVRARGFVGKINDTLLEEAICEIAQEIADEKPPSTRSVRRWLKRAGNTPVVGLLFTDHKAKGNRTWRLAQDGELEGIINLSIRGIYLTPERPSITTLHERIRPRIIEANNLRLLADPCAEIMQVPSENALARAIKRLPLYEVIAAREGKAAADQALKAVRRQGDPEAPLDLIELDHTRADLMVVDEVRLQALGRPNIAIALDRCTRMPLGLYVGFEPESIHTVMQCLRNAILPKDYIREKNEKGEWDIENPGPSGPPRAIRLDRSLAAISDEVGLLGVQVGFHVHLNPRKKPRFKGAVERFIRTMNKDLLQQQRGTTFSNIIGRANYDPRKNAVITYSELVYILHKWLYDHYAQKVHTGLDIFDVPQRRWDELIERYPVKPLRDIAQLEALFGITFTAKLSREGVQFKYIQYISDELVAQLGDPDFRRCHPDGRVTFKVNPGDLSQIRVYLAHLGIWLAVGVSPRWANYVKDLSLAAHRANIDFQNKRAKEACDLDGLSRAKEAIAEVIAEALRRKKIGPRVQAARHMGIGRYSMAGSDHKTGPSPDPVAHAVAAPTPKANFAKAPKPTEVPGHRVTEEFAVPAGVSIDDFDYYSEED